MAKPTNWNIDPHGPDGKIDLKLQEKSVRHGIEMLKSGKEVLIDTTQESLPDGTFRTIFHHKPA